MIPFGSKQFICPDMTEVLHSVYMYTITVPSVHFVDSGRPFNPFVNRLFVARQVYVLVEK